MNKEKNYDVLVTLDCNYADEFDVNGYWLTTKKEFDEFLEELSTCEINDNVEIYFGSNEYISFSSFEYLKHDLSCNRVTPQFANELKYLLGYTFGMINIPDLIYTYKNEYDE